MPARPKVYAARQGFFDTLVAAANQAEALKAWGTHQNLFQDGSASVVTEGDGVAEAQARPGVVLRRVAGSSGPFRPADEAPASLPKPPKAPKPPLSKPSAAEAKPKPPPDRSALDKAEAAVAERQRRYDADLKALEARRRALDAEAFTLRAEFERDRKTLESERRRAETAFRKAGG